MYTKRAWTALLTDAHAGLRDAQFAAGCALLEGVRSRSGRIVVRRNQALGTGWLRQAASAGDTSAMLNLGYCYDCGTGVARSRREALRWYRRAWSADHLDSAASNIASIYRDQGRHRLAASWLQRAIDAGDDDALLELAKAYLDGRGVRRNGAHAVDLLKRAARSNHITESGRDDANYLLGQCYLHGTGVASSLAKARTCFAEANRHGDHPLAAKALARE
jgi:TPR repeat protein